MKHWINKNYKTLIITAFLIPIITVAIVSISHVTTWYGISNPITWAVYLSIGIEIAALSALAAISANMGKKVYFPFAIVTLIQFIGNIFFAYSYINVNSQSFKDWVDLVSPLVSFMGVEATDVVGHKRFLALFAGGMLPMISLSFLHMLVKFTEEDRVKEVEEEEHLKEIQENAIKADVADEMARLKLSERDLEILERFLANPNPPNDALKKAAEEYVEKQEVIEEEPTVEQEVVNEPVVEQEEEIINHVVEEPVEELIIPEVEEEIIPTEEEEEANFSGLITNDTPEEEIFDVFIDEQPQTVEPEQIVEPEPIEEILTRLPEPEAPKYNMDTTVIAEEFKEINNDSFWRDHIQEDDDLKKKI